MAAITYGTAHANAEIDEESTGIYVSLNTGDPGTTGANEVTGGSYARLLVEFDAAANKSASNTNDEEWADMPAATVSHVGFWTAASGGTFKFGAALNSPQAVTAGQTFRLAAGAIDISWP